MLKTIKKIFSPKEVDCSCVMIVYKSKGGTWRGFAHPYDVTIEADSESEALNALKDMVTSYEEGLKKYNFPSHLAQKHLQDEEDNEVFNKIVLNTVFENGSVKGHNYYAETKLCS